VADPLLLVRLLQLMQGKEGFMAYIGPEGYLAVWLPDLPQEDTLADSYIHLLGGAESPEEETGQVQEPSRGFIIQDWFGPFLLGPVSRFLRGRC